MNVYKNINKVNEIKYEGMNYFSNNLKYIRNIETIKLRSILIKIGNKIGYEGIKSFSNNLSNISNLQKLDISCISNLIK